MEKVSMHPYHSNRSPIDKKNTAPSNPSLPFNSFEPKVLEFCQTSHEANDNLSPRNLVLYGNGGLGANNTTANLPKGSFTHPQLAPRSVNLDLASRNFISFWNPDRGSENSMPHRGASVIMRESALPPPAGGNSGDNVLTRPGLAPSGVRHVEDDNPSGLDLELHL
ncbi:hypothetical protein COCNU_01G011760 [Cocos nucifera]|uniref:Uncharacterized protein n=1 Tax=Cocos nucifera TaxID=13894 RepID=A0A8K0HV54_COCNU|nr:hypothetical protein COCNU_01G011760 [Cocos nucifera]